MICSVRQGGEKRLRENMWEENQADVTKLHKWKRVITLHENRIEKWGLGDVRWNRVVSGYGKSSSELHFLKT